jgi:hypothetical protein
MRWEGAGPRQELPSEREKETPGIRQRARAGGLKGKPSASASLSSLEEATGVGALKKKIGEKYCTGMQADDDDAVATEMPSKRLLRSQKDRRGIQKVRRRLCVRAAGLRMRLPRLTSWLSLFWLITVLVHLLEDLSLLSSSVSCSDSGRRRMVPTTAFGVCAQEVFQREDESVETSPDVRRKARASNGSDATAEGAETKKEVLTLDQILYRACTRAMGGGIPGAIAGAIQVLSLMWLRTIINYQCRYGTSFAQALMTLLQDGGIARLYRGVSFALIQAPLARFVSTAANDGIESLLAHLSWTKEWGPGRTTVVASIVVGLWRILLMRK